MHQFKVNGKMAFDGDVWQWHQDYGTWLNDDLMPEPRAMNVAIFLDDVDQFNGPLMFIPGSHKTGVVDAQHDTRTTSYPLWTVEPALISELVARAGGRHGGIVSPKGPAGSMILFHSCLVHASGSNLSPWNRVAVYLSLCAVSNHIRRFKRPEYIAHRDFTAIDCLGDDCLLREDPVDLPWQHGLPASALRNLAGAHRRGSRPHESLRKAATARRRRPADPRRPDRRRQVRLDVPGADPAHAGRAPDGHRRPVAGCGARATCSASAGRHGAHGGAPRSTAALKDGNTHIGDDWRRCVGIRRSMSSSSAPAHPIAAVDHCLAAFAAGKHVVNVTVEADAFCGPLLARRAAEAGVVYSLAFGDQPALICDLVDWARTCGFPVVAAGRGHKWLPHFSESTPETVWGYYGLTPEQAAARRAEPEDVQQLSRRQQAVDREQRGQQRHRPGRAQRRLALPAGQRRGHPLRHAPEAAKAACSNARAWSR